MDIGVQLYTVRDALRDDFNGTLAEISRMGMEFVELAGLHGREAEEVRSVLDGFGLKAPSMHGEIKFQEENLGVPSLVAEAKVLGCRYVVLPWISIKDWEGRWEVVSAALDRAGSMLAAEGLRFCYHNHDFEFRPDANGVLPWEELDRGTTAPHLGYEVDTYWVAFAGFNVTETLTKYQSRLDLAHLKDGTLGETVKHLPVGQGDMDWTPILPKLKEAGTKFGFIELDNYEGDPLEAVAQSWDFLRSRVG